MDLDKLKKLQDNIKNEEVNSLTVKNYVAFIDSYNEKLNELAEAIKTEEFENWLSNTLEEIMTDGFTPLIGLGQEFNKEGDLYKDITFSIVSNKNHKFHPVHIENINMTDADFKTPKIKIAMGSPVEKVLSTLTETIIFLDLDMDFNVAVEPIGDNGVKFLFKISIE